MDILHRVTFAALLADLGMVPAPGLTLPERRALLARLPLLEATEHGRARLATHEPLPPIPAGELVGWIRERVLFYGDASALPVVVDALVRAPEPVRECALHDCAFLAVGIDSGAWTGPAGFVDREGNRVPRVVVLGPAAHTELVLHELGHVWHSSSAAGPAVTSQGEAELSALDGWRERVDAFTAASERLACACAAAWLSPAKPTGAA